MRKSLLTPLICLLALVVFVILFHWLFANRVRVELASGAASGIDFFWHHSSWHRASSLTQIGGVMFNNGNGVPISEEGLFGMGYIFASIFVAYWAMKYEAFRRERREEAERRVSNGKV